MKVANTCWNKMTKWPDLQRFMKKVHLTRYIITYLNLRLSETLPARNIVSMMFKATRHMLKEFFIFGWMRMYPAKLLRKIPMMATTVLVTPSSQKAVSLIQYSSVLVWFGQSKVNLLVFVKLVTFVNSIESKRSRLKELVEFIVSFREVGGRMRDQRPLSPPRACLSFRELMKRKFVRVGKITSSACQKLESSKYCKEDLRNSN